MVDPGAEEDDKRRLNEAAARVGTTLRGKWRLDALLGLGGMAAVYAATHRNGMRGAVKLLDPVIGRTEKMRERFLREGYLANSVDHAAAVLVLDDDTTEDGHVYLVMELLDGRTLEDLAMDAGGKLPLRELLDAMGQLLDALSRAHTRGIVHRDIKPDNLFLTTSGTLKVLDFGIARLLENEMTLSVTQTGSPMGTPAFMSPEQARGRSSLVDAQSDLYSVGATMFTLLTNELVHGSEGTISEYVAATFTTQARSLAAVAPDVPAPIVALVDRALRLEKSERWASAAEMQAALQQAYLAVFGEPLPPPPVPTPRVSRPSLVSLHDIRSLTPVSRPPSSPPLSSPPSSQRGEVTITPAPLPTRGSPWRWAAIGAAAVVVAGLAFGLSRKHPAPPASLPVVSIPSPPEHPVVEEVKAAPPPPVVQTSAATSEPTKPAATTPKLANVGKAIAAPKPSSPSAAASAAPSAAASAPAAPTVNLYDRRY